MENCPQSICGSIRKQWRIIGYCILGFVLFVIILFIVFPPVPVETYPPQARMRRALREISVGIHGYRNEYQEYPAWAKGSQGANLHFPPDSPSYQIPTFRRWVGPEETGSFARLTTPLAFLTGIRLDFYSDRASFGYYTDGEGFVIFSAGPDHDYDLDAISDYTSSVPQPSEILANKIYDPTNGQKSSGDIMAFYPRKGRRLFEYDDK